MTSPKDIQDEPLKLYDPNDTQESFAEDYSDIDIDLVPSSREQRLGWNRYAIDSTKGWNDYD